MLLRTTENPIESPKGDGAYDSWANPGYWIGTVDSYGRPWYTLLREQAAELTREQILALPSVDSVTGPVGGPYTAALDVDGQPIYTIHY